MSKFQAALEEERRKALLSNRASSTAGTGTCPPTRPVQINLTKDKVAGGRVIRAAARRVIEQHRDEIEALAYK